LNKRGSPFLCSVKELPLRVLLVASVAHLRELGRQFRSQFFFARFPVFFGVSRLVGAMITRSKQRSLSASGAPTDKNPTDSLPPTVSTRKKPAQSVQKPSVVDEPREASPASLVLNGTSATRRLDATLQTPVPDHTSFSELTGWSHNDMLLSAERPLNPASSRSSSDSPVPPPRRTPVVTPGDQTTPLRIALARAEADAMRHEERVRLLEMQVARMTRDAEHFAHREQHLARLQANLEARENKLRVDTHHLEQLRADILQREEQLRKEVKRLEERKEEQDQAWDELNVQEQEFRDRCQRHDAREEQLAAREIHVDELQAEIDHLREINNQQRIQILRLDRATPSRITTPSARPASGENHPVTPDTAPANQPAGQPVAPPGPSPPVAIPEVAAAEIDYFGPDLAPGEACRAPR
jgi:hypothetical protein